MSFLSAVGGFTPIDATGGTTVTTFTDSAGIEYQIHAFENVGTDTFTVNNAGDLGTVDVLLVAGGGGGGGSRTGGAGGAGGVIFEQTLSVTNQSYSVDVGSGGASVGDTQEGLNGDDTTLFGLTAIGGGGGGQGSSDSERRGNDGGSGGGVRHNFDTNNPGQGLQPASSDGGFGSDAGNGVGNNYGGGGGGATQTGGDNANDTRAGSGGDGLDVSASFGTQFGENGVFGGGGGGGFNKSPDRYNGNGAPGGLGGGGDGGAQGQDGFDASPNTGGGGGSPGNGDPLQSGAGGSGIVLIRYPLEAP